MTFHLCFCRRSIVMFEFVICRVQRLEVSISTVDLKMRYNKNLTSVTKYVESPETGETEKVHESCFGKVEVTTM